MNIIWTHYEHLWNIYEHIWTLYNTCITLWRPGKFLRGGQLPDLGWVEGHWLAEAAVKMTEMLRVPYPEPDGQLNYTASTPASPPTPDSEEDEIAPDPRVRMTTSVPQLHQYFYYIFIYLIVFDISLIFFWHYLNIIWFYLDMMESWWTWVWFGFLYLFDWDDGWRDHSGDDAELGSFASGQSDPWVTGLLSAPARAKAGPHPAACRKDV